MLGSRDAAVREFDDVAERERFFDTGQRQVARLVAKIEADTGSVVESRRALELGCGVGRLVLALAERCEHVYGVDISPGALREADRNAKRMNVSNVEWLETGRLEELSGRYDLVLSATVFQHIQPREGERILATLLQGLRPGGVGAINVMVRPNNRITALLRWTRKSVRAVYNPFRLLRAWEKYYGHMNTYSLNRLGRVLADAGISDWHTHFIVTPETAHDGVIIIFRKD